MELLPRKITRLNDDAAAAVLLLGVEVEDGEKRPQKNPKPRDNRAEMR